jgi:hypothetical protein
MNFSIKRADVEKEAPRVMRINLRKTVVVIATMCVTSSAFLITGCTEKSKAASIAKQPPGTAETIDSRSKVIGVEPAAPTKETSGTTPIVKSDMTKAEAATAMPMTGQANDHSALVPPTPQKTN